MGRGLTLIAGSRLATYQDHDLSQKIDAFLGNAGDDPEFTQLVEESE
jgi:hypothetical protein